MSSIYAGRLPMQAQAADVVQVAHGGIGSWPACDCGTAGLYAKRGQTVVQYAAWFRVPCALLGGGQAVCRVRFFAVIVTFRACRWLLP
mmetsp:Transcript_5372/g.11594  ORF Transcript_5372/g.11594 Transcript_5372/m.11594 type:complete len:88 (-) Transcript_5372:392-655(-)